MKKQTRAPLFLLTAAFGCLVLGLFLGRNLFRSVPSAITPAPSDAQSFRVIDINRADSEELMTLPGIGPELSRRILDYRNTHGSFTSLTELLHIEGIGEATLESLLPYITAGG